MTWASVSLIKKDVFLKKHNKTTKMTALSDFFFVLPLTQRPF